MGVLVTAPGLTTAEELLSLNGDGKALDLAGTFEVQQFYNFEARILDEERLRDWYDLLDDSLRYWAPLRENRYRKDKRPEINPLASAFFDETKDTIDLRLQRLESGMAWAEDPPTRHVYAISNVEAFATDTPNVIEAHSIFTLYRNRSERDQSTLMGRRKDLLIKTDDGFKIKGRLILLQQSTLLAKNLSYFF